MNGIETDDSIIDDFIINYNNGIKTIHKMYYSNQITFDLFIQNIKSELKIIYHYYNDLSKEEFEQNIFYIINEYAKNNSDISTSLRKERAKAYICPGCSYFNIKTIINSDISLLKCKVCEESLINSQSEKHKSLFKTFKIHNKSGYKCPECERFIPRPVYGINNNIICPYLDCCFMGSVNELKKMHHPSESYDSNFDDKKDQNLSFPKLENISLLKDIIESLKNSSQYTSYSFTAFHKYASFQAIENLLNRSPDKMFDYLINQSRTGGFQSKIFQEYVSIIENLLPLVYKKGKKVIRINSLLDENLSIFEGVSIFESQVSENLEIQNNTKEFYIGGRTAAYSQPYFLGKILNIINKDTKETLVSCIKECSFSKIKMKDIAPGTPVIVSHLRIPPHYQMGGMVYINRARKDIVEKYQLLSKNEL